MTQSQKHRLANEFQNRNESASDCSSPRNTANHSVELPFPVDHFEEEDFDTQVFQSFQPFSARKERTSSEKVTTLSHSDELSRFKESNDNEQWTPSSSSHSTYMNEEMLYRRYNRFHRRSASHFKQASYDQMADATFSSYDSSVDKLALEELLNKLQMLEPRLYGACKFALHENVTLKEKLQQMTHDYGVVLDKAKQLEYELQQARKQLKVLLENDLSPKRCRRTSSSPPSMSYNYFDQHERSEEEPDLMTSCVPPTEHLHKEICQLQQENEHLKTKVSKLESEKQALVTREVEQSSRWRDELSANNVSLREKCEELVRVIKELHHAMDSIRNLRSENEKLTNLLTKMEIEHAATLDRVTELKEKKKQHSLASSVLRDRLDECQSRLTALQEEHISLIQQMRTNSFPSNTQSTISTMPMIQPNSTHSNIPSHDNAVPSPHMSLWQPVFIEHPPDLNTMPGFDSWEDVFPHEPHFSFTFPHSGPTACRHAPQSLNQFPHDSCNTKSFADELHELLPTSTPHQDDVGRRKRDVSYPPLMELNPNQKYAHHKHLPSVETSPLPSSSVTSGIQPDLQKSKIKTNPGYYSRSASNSDGLFFSEQPSFHKQVFPRPNDINKSCGEMKLSGASHQHHERQACMSPCSEFSVSYASSGHTNAIEEENGLCSESVALTSSMWGSNFSTCSSFISLGRTRKLDFVKPLDGSRTLNRWKDLATPSLVSALIDETPGNVHSRVMHHLLPGTVVATPVGDQQDSVHSFIKDDSSTAHEKVRNEKSHSPVDGSLPTSVVPLSVSNVICNTPLISQTVMVSAINPPNPWKGAGLLSGLFSLATRTWSSSMNPLNPSASANRLRSYSGESSHSTTAYIPYSATLPRTFRNEETQSENMRSISMQGFNSLQSNRSERSSHGIVHRYDIVKDECLLIPEALSSDEKT